MKHFLVVGLIISGAGAMANEDVNPLPETGIETIEVTAQKRVQSIQKVPLSMNAYDGLTLREQHITQTQQIMSLSPNANATNSAGGMTNYFIRGVGLDDFNLSSVSAVGLYLDDVSINNPMATGFSMFDLARVEVLRGPQNTLFGKNTTGGAVALHTVKPDFDTEQDNYWQMGWGRFNELNLEGAMGYALNDTSAIRLSLFSHQRDGIIRSSDPDNTSQYGNIDRSGLRFQLLHQFSPAFELHLNLHGGKQDQITGVRKLVIGDDYIDLNQYDIYTIDSPLINPVNDLDNTGGFLKLSYQWPEFSLTAISAFEQVESMRTDDWGAQNAPSRVWAVQTYNSTDTRHFSQEFQLKSKPNDSVNWLAGVSYSVDKGDLLQVAYIDPGSQGRGDDTIDDAGGGPLFDRGAWVKQDSKTWSAYFNVDKSLNKTLNLNVGYRLSQQRFRPVVQSTGMMMDDPTHPFPLGSFGWYSLGNPDFDFTTDVVGFERIENFLEANNGPAATANINEDFKEWGAKIGISAQTSETLMSYAHVSKGFKMGAVNSNPTTVTFSTLMGRVVKPESLLTYEIGFKSDWLNRRLRLNGALFYNHWNDYQYFLASNPGPPPLLLASLVNIPKAKSKGAELQFQWQLQNTTTLSVNAGWLDTKITDANLDTQGIPEPNLASFTSQVVNGNELTNAPDLTYNIGINQLFNPSWALIKVGLNYHYQSAHTHQFEGNNSPVWLDNFSEGETGLINLNVQFEFGALEQYKLSLWGKNLADKQHCTERNAVPGTDTQVIRLCNQATPLMYGVLFNMAF